MHACLYVQSYVNEGVLKNKKGKVLSPATQKCGKVSFNFKNHMQVKTDINSAAQD